VEPVEVDGPVADGVAEPDGRAVVPLVTVELAELAAAVDELEGAAVLLDPDEPPHPASRSTAIGITIVDLALTHAA